MRRKTNEEFVKELSQIHPNMKALEPYIKGHSKIEFECQVCGHKWRAYPYAVLQGSGCPKCANRYNRTHEEFVQEMSDINDKIIIKSEFKNIKEKVLVECKVCGHEWFGTPGHLLRGIGCPNCKAIKIGKIRRLDNDTFINRLKEINKDITVLSEYQYANEKVKCSCNNCGHVWYATPYNLLNNHGCPRCTVSKGEKRISDFLSENNIHYESPKKYQGLNGVKGGLLSYDFYLNQYNLLIEFQGKQHASPVNFTGRGMEDAKQRLIVQNEHDKRKREYAEQNGINLLEIWYYDFENIESLLREEINKIEMTMR